MQRRIVPSARAALGERDAAASLASRRRSEKTTTTAAVLLDLNNNKHCKPRAPSSSQRLAPPFFHRSAPAWEIWHMRLAAGCFSVAVGIVVLLQLWSAIDRAFPSSPMSGFSKIIPWNPILYHAALADAVVVGDRSDRYAQLRFAANLELPENAERSLARVQQLQLHTYRAFAQQPPSTATTSIASDTAADGDATTTTTTTTSTYNVLDCPPTPPPGYPFAWNIMDILGNWPADSTKPRPRNYQGLCVFDYETDYEKAIVYRNAEVPFVVVNDPAVAATAERWNSPGYMEHLIGSDVEHRVERSESNHFMYFAPGSKFRRVRSQNRKVPDGWTEPTTTQRMSYKNWLAVANVTDDELGPDKPHWYFRLFGDGVVTKHSSDYLFDELPFFQPNRSLYLVEQEKWGINCRFGMKGVIAATHFDGSRNALVVLGGSRRYILAHPDQCDKMALYPMGHPSSRQSAVDWSHPDLEKYPEFAKVQANEVVLQAGQVMYLPTDWFHFIVSLELNFQCNSRSGVGNEYRDLIQQCGFM